VPTQEAVANLFAGNRDALTASASAALSHPLTLPQQVVFVGHSYGANTVLGAAADMVDNGTINDLAGIVLLDGVPTEATAVPALATLPATIPVYNIASPPYF
jgi:pimeloyl-ACP methyl ester carboxylesterase